MLIYKKSHVSPLGFPANKYKYIGREDISMIYLTKRH